MNESPLTRLKDLITIAVICLSPLVAWLTYVSSLREKRRERFAEIQRGILEVKSEVDYVGNWARAVYSEKSHSDNWNNPFWRVNDFPSEHIQEFNRQANPLEVGRSLSDALIQLESSISRFRKLLAKHKQFVEKGLDTYANLGSFTSAISLR
jgi:hypothetical protein